MSKTKKVLLFLLIFLQVLPFLFPSRNNERITDPPFYNSVFYQVDDIRLHARVWESFSNKGNVLLIHGLGGSTYSWVETAQRLQKEGYNVVAVDLPGLGYSDRPTDFAHTQENRAELLWQFLDMAEDDYPGIKQNGKWSLVGHSMGGGTAAAMAVADQGRTEMLVLIAGVLFENGNPWYAKILYYPPAAKWLEVFLDQVVFRENQIREILLSADADGVTDEQVQGYLDPLKIKYTGISLARMLRTSKSLEEEAYESLYIPVYGIWGEEDPWVLEVETDRIKALIPQSKFFFIENAGHLPMETHPNQFQRDLLQILSTLE